MLQLSYLNRIVKISLIALLFTLTIHAQIKNDPHNGEIYNPDGIALVYAEGNDTIKGFYIGKYEVTQAQWQIIMNGNPNKFKGTDNLPVENVSWNEVQEFLACLNFATGKNYRLPTETEWEFAARGGLASRRYRYSGSNDFNNVAWCKNNSGRRTHPVGEKQPNELGIHDMNGNVWEWCEDKEGSNRVYRGGGWFYSASSCLSRYYANPNSRSGNLGFRVVLSL